MRVFFGTLLHSILLRIRYHRNVKTRAHGTACVISYSKLDYNLFPCNFECLLFFCTSLLILFLLLFGHFLSTSCSTQVGVKKIYSIFHLYSRLIVYRWCILFAPDFEHTVRSLDCCFFHFVRLYRCWFFGNNCSTPGPFLRYAIDSSFSFLFHTKGRKTDFIF